MSQLLEDTHTKLIGDYLHRLIHHFPKLSRLAAGEINIESLREFLDRELRWGLYCNLSLEDILLFSSQGRDDNFFEEVNRHICIRSLFYEIEKIILLRTTEKEQQPNHRHLELVKS